MMNQAAKELDYVSKIQNLVFVRKRKQRLKNVALMPWNTPPEGSVPMDELGSAAGAGTSGTRIILVSFSSPLGWDSLISTIITKYTGTNFTPNSGDLIWALRVNGCYINGYQSIESEYGDLANGLTIRPGVVVKSGQLVEIIVDVLGTFIPDANSQILAGVSGFTYPNAIARTS